MCIFWTANSAFIRLPVSSNRRTYVFHFVLRHFNYPLLFLKLNKTKLTLDLISFQDNPYLEGIEVKFQQDLLRGFEGTGISGTFTTFIVNDLIRISSCGPRQSDLRCQVTSLWALPQISSCFSFLDN